MAALNAGSCGWVVGGMGGDCRWGEGCVGKDPTAPKTASRGTRLRITVLGIRIFLVTGFLFVKNQFHDYIRDYYCNASQRNTLPSWEAVFCFGVQIKLDNEECGSDKAD